MDPIRPTKINRAAAGIGVLDTFNRDRLKTKSPHAIPNTLATKIPGSAWNLNISEPNRVPPTISFPFKMARAGMSKGARNSKSVSVALKDPPSKIPNMHVSRLW